MCAMTSKERHHPCFSNTATKTNAAHIHQTISWLTSIIPAAEEAQAGAGGVQ